MILFLMVFKILALLLISVMSEMGTNCTGFCIQFYLSILKYNYGL